MVGFVGLKIALAMTIAMAIRENLLHIHQTVSPSAWPG
jgi:uncharacterized protein (DUF2062 family)